VGFLVQAISCKCAYAVALVTECLIFQAISWRCACAAAAETQRTYVFALVTGCLILQAISWRCAYAAASETPQTGFPNMKLRAVSVDKASLNSVLRTNFYAHTVTSTRDACVFALVSQTGLVDTVLDSAIGGTPNDNYSLLAPFQVTCKKGAYVEGLVTPKGLHQHRAAPLASPPLLPSTFDFPCNAV